MNTPPPIFVPNPGPLPSVLVASELLRAVIGTETCRALEAQEVAVGKACASFIADRLGVTWADAWDALGHVPNSMLPLLRTAAGWASLADHIASTSGGPRPTVH